MENKKKLTKEQLLQERVQKVIQEKFVGGLGFGDNRHVINSLKKKFKEGSNETGIDVPEAPIKSKGNSSLKPSFEPPVKSQNSSPELDMPKQEKPKAPEKPKPKSKDWNELVDEVVLYIKFASDIVGDSTGSNASKILDKLYDVVSEKLTMPDEAVAEISEKKKLKEKKR